MDINGVVTSLNTDKLHSNNEVTSTENPIDMSNYSPTIIEKSLISLDHNSKPNQSSLIAFDLETSGLPVGVEILQISAVCKDKEFDVYINPKYTISAMASDVNKLTVEDGVLFYKGKPVDSMCIIDALEDFMNWLNIIPPPRILIGHNIKRFDCPHIFYHLNQYNFVSRFCNLVEGFIDTLPLFRQVFPNMKNYCQNTLVKNILNESYEEHNAIEDVRALQKLTLHAKISDMIYLNHSFTSHSMWEFFEFDMSRKSKLHTFDCMKYRNVISTPMALRFASSGIFYQDLETAYKIGGKFELDRFLGRRVNGIKVGTENKRILDNIFKYIENTMMEDKKK